MKLIPFVLVACLALVGCPGGEDVEEEEGGGPAAPLCAEPESIPRSVKTHLDVGVKCRNVVVSAQVSVSNDGKLKFAPGTTVTFASGAGLRFDGGIIEAVGTPDARITFKGEETVPGFWRGITLYKAASTQNVLEHVIIESAGSAASTYADAPGGLTVQDDSRLQVRNTVLRKNAGYGIVLEGSQISAFANNELTENALGAAHVHVNSVGQLLPENNYAGNAVDEVKVTGGGLKVPVTFHDVGVPFVTRSIEVQTNGRMKIEPGTELRFEAGAELHLTGGILEARGTAEAPILLVGAETTPGFWKGIGLHSSASTENILDHVRIFDAGSAKFTYADHVSSIYIDAGTDRLVIRNTTIGRGKGFALQTRQRDVRLPEFSNNVLTGHELGAAFVSAATANDLDAGSSYKGNAVGRDVVVIDPVELRSPSTWRALDVPYRVEGAQTIGAGGHLTIEAGTEVQFISTGSLDVNATTGQLNVRGTAEAPVLLTPTPDNAHWKGVRIGSSNTNNSIAHTRINAGGATPFTYFNSGNGGNLVVDSSRVELTAVRLSNGNNYGLAVRGDHQIRGCDEITYSDNASGTVFGTPSCN